MTRADLDYLINGIVNGLGGSGGFGRGYTGRGSSIGRGAVGRDISGADFDREENRHNKAMDDIVDSRLNDGVLKYYKERKKYQEDINELLELQSELEQDLNDSLIEQEEIIEKIQNGTATDDEKARLEEILEKREKLNRSYEEEEKIRGRLNSMSFGDSLVSSMNNITGMFKQIHGAINDLTKPYQKVDAAASKYAKTVGMTKAGMDSLAKTSLNNVASKLASTYNISTEELLEAQSNYIKASGRNIRLDNADQENMAAMHKMGGNGNELAALYDNFGVSMEETADHVGKMFSDASKQGLSFEKYSDNVAKNIKIAQNYTFKNGLKGLESMAKKATAMKMDMQQVAALADKVSTVEGAIDVSSQLQVLGGPFAQLADPLGMLNEGLNDMEGLQDRLIKMVGGLGSFDKETGEVKVSSFNKQRIKAASQAMGVDYGTIMESVNAQARRGEISKQIAASEVASGFSDDMKELIMNSGTIKDGKAGVSIRGQFKSVDELTEKDYEALQAESRSESEDIKVTAQSLQSIEEKIQSFETAKEARQAQMYDKVAEGFGSVMKWLSKLGPLLTIVSIIQGIVAAGQIMGSLGRGFKGLKNGAKSIFNRGARGASNAMVRGSANAMKGVSSTVGKDVTKATGGVVKGSVSQTAKRAAIKTLGKQGAKTAVKLGAGLAKGMAVAGPLGIVGAVGDVATDALVASGKMKKGGVGHHLAKGASGAASGAAMGAMIGSVIPGVGTAIGAVVGGIGGAIKGLFQAGKAKQERILEGKLKDTGVTVKGKYNRRKLKQINAALETGEISKRMRRKLEKSGDHELLALIDKKAEENKDKPKQKKKFFDTKLGRAMMIASPMLGMGVLGVRGIKKLANSKVGKAIGRITNPKTKLGKAMMMASPVGAAIMAGRGISRFFKKNKIEKFQGKSKKSAADILSSYNTTVKPILEKGNNAKYGAVNKANNDIHLKSDPHDIKINGTLNLKGQDGKTIDLVSELKNNPQMLRQVSGMISNEMSVLQKGANIVQRA